MELFKNVKFDPEEFEKELALKREKLMAIPEISRLCKEKQIPIEKVSQLSYFEEYLDSCKLCVGCKGLNECRQSLKGLRMSLNYDYTLYQVKEYCPYYYDLQKKDAFKKYLVYSDIPTELEYLTLDDVDVDKTNQDHLKLWVLYKKLVSKEFNQGLYVYGNFGTGKTYLSIALANSLAKNSEKVAFVKVTTFVNKMRQYVVSDHDLYDEILEDVKRVKYLIMDDIGTESMTSFVRDDILFNLLDYRMENNLITIFTSNHSFNSLREALLYDKNYNRETLKADRLMERIKVLSREYFLGGSDRRFK